MGDSLALRSVSSLPTITETDGSNVIVSEDVLQEPSSSRQADTRLVEGHALSEKPETDLLKTLQQITSDEKKKKTRMRKWSREGRSNPLLLSGDNKRGYVLTEGTLEFGLSTKVFATGPDHPLETKYCFPRMLCRRKVCIRTRGSMR